VSDIGLARDRLYRIAARLRRTGRRNTAARIDAIVQNLMYRRSPARRMSAHSQPVTPAVRRQVIALARSTNLHSAEIAVRLNLNPGRVSEIINP
jgi:hypothetical protein